MQIKFLGAAGIVTGSCYQLTTERGLKILIDCGMFMGTEKIERLNYEPLQLTVSQLSGALLTHAHLDHCGRLPLLVRKGFRGRVFMTAPTRDLIEVSLFDTVSIFEHEKVKPPLYTAAEVEKLLSLTQVVEYDQPFTIGDYTVTYRDAGHILGSSSIEIETGSDKKVVFSGDLGNSPQPIERPTYKIKSADVVVMESTYGDRTHPKEDPMEILSHEINEVEKSGGTLLMPTFSIERTQVILHIIDHLKKESKVKASTAVFLDSPMAIKVTRVYKQYPKLYSFELAAHTRRDDPFDFPGFTALDSRQDAKILHKYKGPKVIIAGSGMMTGGRILQHAVRFLPRPSTRMLFTGYQGEDTLGRQILSGYRRVRIGEKEIKINAIINEISALSAHADQPMLLSWLGSIDLVKHVFLTHGDNGPRQVLASKITQMNDKIVLYTPRLYEELTFS